MALFHILLLRCSQFVVRNSRGAVTFLAGDSARNQLNRLLLEFHDACNSFLVLELVVVRHKKMCVDVEHKFYGLEQRMHGACPLRRLESEGRDWYLVNSAAGHYFVCR